MSFVDEVIGKLRLQAPQADVLHDWKSGNSFCGPAAFNVLTGVPTVEAAKLIKAVSRVRAVKGVHVQHLVEALRRHGLRLARVAVPKKGWSLQRWLTEHAPEGRYLIVAGNHYVCASVRESRVLVCDNWTKKPTPVEDYARKRTMITDVFYVPAKGVDKLAMN